MRFLSVKALGLSVLFIGVHPASGAEQRHAHSHVHGAAEMNLVVEGKTVVVELRSPAEGIMGFEHEAKSDADEKKRDAALKVLKERFGEIVILDKKLACEPGLAEVTVVRTDATGKDAKHAKGDAKKGGEHREVRARHIFTCQGDPAGSRVRFGITKVFPNVHELKVQALSGNKQSGATIKKDKGEVRL